MFQQELKAAQQEVRTDWSLRQGARRTPRWEGRTWWPEGATDEAGPGAVEKGADATSDKPPDRKAAAQKERARARRGRPDGSDLRGRGVSAGVGWFSGRAGSTSDPESEGYRRIMAYGPGGDRQGPEGGCLQLRRH